MYDDCVAADVRQIPKFVAFDEEEWRRPRPPVEIHTDQAFKLLAQLAGD